MPRIRVAQEHGFNIPPFIVDAELNEVLFKNVSLWCRGRKPHNNLEMLPIAFDTEDPWMKSCVYFLSALEEDNLFIETLQKKVVAELKQASIVDDPAMPCAHRQDRKTAENILMPVSLRFFF
ncbi:MAG: hypothetical protein R3D26_15370 [Cyanobacteriota/Melainabacteria group bacterium]